MGHANGLGRSSLHSCKINNMASCCLPAPLTALAAVAFASLFLTCTLPGCGADSLCASDACASDTVINNVATSGNPDCTAYDQTAAGNGNIAYVQGIAYGAGDYSPATDPNSCCTSCYAQTGCDAWSFTPGNPPETGACFKSSSSSCARLAGIFGQSSIIGQGTQGYFYGPGNAVSSGRTTGGHTHISVASKGDDVG